MNDYAPFYVQCKEVGGFSFSTTQSLGLENLQFMKKKKMKKRIPPIR